VSENSYWQRIRDLVETAQTQRQPKHEIADEIVNLVYAADNRREPWAADVLDRWANAGASADYTRVFKDLNTVSYIRADGRRVRRTVGYSRPVRSAESGEVIGRQMQAWWGMGRAAVGELRNELAEQRGQLDDVLSALDRLLAAMDRHPGCTAREAWEADGHDITEIDLSQVASA
jgi:hypothetical protein